MRTAAVLALLLATAAHAGGPNDAVLAALADARALPADLAARTRYLSLYPVPEGERAKATAAVDFWVNSLSRESEIVRCRRVSPDLLAVVLDDYGIDPRQWDRLADVDPWFSVRLEGVRVVEVEEVYGYATDVHGARVPQGTPGSIWVTTRTAKARKEVKGARVAAAAPWLDAGAVAELILRTGSKAPVVRADWWLYQTGIQRKGQVGYYDLLGLGNKEADFQKLIGADIEASRKVRKEIAGVLARSGVAINNRRVVRFQSLTGGYWITEDFKTSTDRKNILRFLDGDSEPPAGDAREEYGVLPNSLFAFYLSNAEGVRQEVVPPDIATDGVVASNDRQIYAGVSCVRCHVEGLRPVDDYARRLYRGAIRLQSPDYARFVRLRQLYLSDLDGQLRRDREDYARAVLRVNGLTPAQNARTLAAVYDGYDQADLTPDDAARELGVSRERLIEAVKAYAVARQAAQGSADPVVLSLLADPPLPIRREHMDELVPVFMDILRRY